MRLLLIFSDADDYVRSCGNKLLLQTTCMVGTENKQNSLQTQELIIKNLVNLYFIGHQLSDFNNMQIQYTKLGA